MSEAPILVETDGPVCTIILNRPQRRNAVDGPMAALLRDAFLAFEADDRLRVAVLWGAQGVWPDRAHALHVVAVTGVHCWLVRL